MHLLFANYANFVEEETGTAALKVFLCVAFYHKKTQVTTIIIMTGINLFQLLYLQAQFGYRVANLLSAWPPYKIQV